MVDNEEAEGNKTKENLSEDPSFGEVRPVTRIKHSDHAVSLLKQLVSLENEISQLLVKADYLDSYVNSKV